MQLAALDFIACATSDVFAMTDSGSQLSSLVSGYRVYHGDGQAPTLRPNKKRFAKILSENETISWDQFKDRVTKMIDEGHRVRSRRWGRSIYRQPRTPGCMCKDSSWQTSTMKEVFLQLLEILLSSVCEYFLIAFNVIIVSCSNWIMISSET